MQCLLERVSSSSLCVGLAVLFSCGTTWAFHITIFHSKTKYQRTNGPVNAHLISWPSKAQNIQNLENIW